MVKGWGGMGRVCERFQVQVPMGKNIYLSKKKKKEKKKRVIPPLLLPRLGQIYREAETVGCVRKACFLLMKSVLIGQRISIYVEAKPKKFPNIYRICWI